MFSHVTVGTSDFETAFDFYSKVTAELGLVLNFREDERPWAGWTKPGSRWPQFVLTVPHDGGQASSGNGSMTAFLASSRQQVEAAYRAAMSAGAKSEGAPGMRPEYHEHYYGAYFRDPDGNKLCVCCHEPE